MTTQDPLVTIAFPSYGHARYVREALRSVLAQTYSPIQIVISDDASTDRSYEIIRDELSGYCGRHRVTVHRNETRMGIENYNRIMELAEGELIVVAHSDDISLPERTSRLVEVWQSQEVSLISSNLYVIDGKGQSHGLGITPDEVVKTDLETLAKRAFCPTLRGSTLAWERNVFDFFGPLNGTRTALSTDSILPFRAALLRGIHYVAEPLVKCRDHAGGRSMKLLHHNNHDDDAHQESYLGNFTSQFVYMFETLQQFRKQPGCDDPKWDELNMQLARSIIGCAASWTGVRNKMLRANKQVQWVTNS